MKHTRIVVFYNRMIYILDVYCAMITELNGSSILGLDEMLLLIVFIMVGLIAPKILYVLLFKPSSILIYYTLIIAILGLVDIY